MGYGTNFILKHDSTTVDNEEIAASLDSFTGYMWEDDLEREGIKWYDWHEHMVKLSTMYPLVLFTLYGAGEDRDDNWVAYFKAGKSNTAKAVCSYPAFDQTKMK